MKRRRRRRRKIGTNKTNQIKIYGWMSRRRRSKRKKLERGGRRKGEGPVQWSRRRGEREEGRTRSTE